MTDETSVLTTGADFDQAMRDGMTAALADDEPSKSPSTESAPTEVTETPAEDDISNEQPPEFFDMGDDDPEEGLPNSVSDVAELIKAGKTDDAIKRLGDYSKGLEKLQAKASEGAESVNTLRNVEAMYYGLGQGDDQAINDLQGVLARCGTSIEALFAKATGLDPEELKQYVPNAQGLTATEANAKARQAKDPELEALKAEMQAIKAERETKAWADQYGSAMAKFVENHTGLKFNVDDLASARHLLKGNPSIDSILDAVMQTRPRAYRAAQAALEKPSPAPKSASITKGGKSSGSTVDPAALLNNPRAMEEYMRST